MTRKAKQASNSSASKTKSVNRRKSPPSAKSPTPADRHPSYRDMLIRAMETLQQQRHSCTSRLSLIRYIMDNYDVGEDKAFVNRHVKAALRSGMAANTFQQCRGRGAAGTFKLGPKLELELKRRQHGSQCIKSAGGRMEKQGHSRGGRGGATVVKRLNLKKKE